MQELGDLLREARLEKGMTLEDVENITKIRKRYLEAIEEGDFKVLPGTFYVRAFIKSYAETVGLDAEQVMRLYRNVVPDPDSQTHNEIYTKSRRRKNINTEKWSKLASTLVFICFLAVVVGVIYYYLDQNAEPRNEIDENIPITQKEEMPEDPDGTISDHVIEPDTSADPSIPLQPEPEPQPEPVLAKVGTENGADLYVLKHADKLHIRMESESNDCWYAVYDGGYRQNQIDTGTLKPGEAKDYEFEEVGHFHLGFAKTIKLTVNGIEFKPSEREGSFHVMIQLEKSE